MKSNKIKYFELNGNKWTPTAVGTLKKGYRYIKLYEFINEVITFKGIGIYKKVTT